MRVNAYDLNDERFLIDLYDFILRQNDRPVLKNKKKLTAVLRTTTNYYQGKEETQYHTFIFLSHFKHTVI